MTSPIERLRAALSGRYEIERELGSGGMAAVYLARDTAHDRFLAIKVMRPELASALGADRFVREVRITANIRHPGIVPLLDSGVLRDDDTTSLPWFAMPYLPGESLRVRLDREMQLPVDEAVRIARDVADALHTAHQQGIVHRDIKPENLLLADGRVFVLDFGIAKAVAETEDARLTSTGVALGTPAYMSPEQAAAGPVDARTDQYSLAAVLYEMLAGEAPFAGPNPQAMIARRLAEPARPIRSVRPAVPEVLEAAVLRALERVPADRFPDTAAFARALDANDTLHAIAGSAKRRQRRRVGPLIALAAALLAISAWPLVKQFNGAAPPPTESAAAGLYRRGMAAYDSRTANGVAEAIALFGAAVQRDSFYAPAWGGLAKAYVRAFQRAFVFPGYARDSALRLAVAAVDRALALDTSDASVWVAQGELSKQVDPTSVRIALRAGVQALKLDSASGPAWHLLALSYAEGGDLQKAIALWREAVNRSPAYTQGLAFLGVGLYWSGAYDSAMVWVDSAVAVNPNYLLGRTTTGDVAIELGEADKAIAAYEAALRLSTDVETVNGLSRLAQAQARSGRRDVARVSVRRADSLAQAYTPTSTHVAVYLAHAYAHLGDADRAIAWLRSHPTPRDLHFQLHLRCDPPFRPLVKDRRFHDIVLGDPRPGAC